MEHYILQENDTKNVKSNLKEYEIEIDTHSRYNHVLRTCTRTLENWSKVTILAQGSLVTKAVNIAEDLKSSFSQIEQRIEIYFTEHRYVWIPNSDERLDSIEVTRKIPSIKIFLAKQEHKVSVMNKLNKEAMSLLHKQAKELCSGKMSSPKK